TNRGERGNVSAAGVGHHPGAAFLAKFGGTRWAMSEKSIFLGALDQADPAARAAYLDAVCAGDPGLRQRVEALLESYQAAGAFPDVPAVEQADRDERALTFLSPPGVPGSLGRLDHYEVLEVVGRGGMGVVLKARDTKLQRVVAIKVLALRLAGDA